MKLIAQFCQMFRMRQPAVFLMCALSFCQARSEALQNTDYEKDFHFYWQTVYENFAYFDGQQRKRADWEKVRDIYAAKAASASNKADLVRLLESANNELFNGHVTLNTNLPSSNRIIPSGSDLWAVKTDGRFVISDVREDFSAARSGVRPGMVLKSFGDVPIDEAVKKFLPVSVSSYNPAMYEYAVNMLLAGAHDRPRKIEVFDGGSSKTFYPDKTTNRVDTGYTTLLLSSVLPGGVGYIKINNSLGDTELIKAFDQALDPMLNTRGLILDLRETPSGGNTTVARGILGRFVSSESPYQRISCPEEMRLYGVERSDLDLVAPRGRKYMHPVVVLVGRWTGSVGEGLAIGFNSTKAAEIAGTKMAGLLGAICSYQLPVSKIGFSLPCQQTIQVNGKPREDFIPPHSVPPDKDAIQLAERLLDRKKK